MLCDSEACAGVAERHRHDAGEDAEAESAREWAAGKFSDQDVQLLRRPGETTTAAADMLAAVPAVQQESMGGSTERVVLTLDEAACLARESGLFPDRTLEGVRAEIERLIRTGRTPYPTERRYAKTAGWDLGRRR